MLWEAGFYLYDNLKTMQPLWFWDATDGQSYCKGPTQVVTLIISVQVIELLTR